MLLNRGDYESLLTNMIADGRMPSGLRSVYLTIHEQNPELASRVLTEVVDANGAIIGGEASFDTTELVDPVAGIPDPKLAAAKLGVPVESVHGIKSVEERIQAAAAPLSAPVDVDVAAAPWLDYRPSAPPEPWNEAHYERDVRRMASAQTHLPELELHDLDRETWRAYAEMGVDAVTHLINERRQGKIDELVNYRDTLISIGASRLAAREAELQRQKGVEADSDYVRDFNSKHGTQW